MLKINEFSELPIKCPSCGGGLQVKSLSCPGCETKVLGHYELPVLLMLDKEELGFILEFIKNSGSLKEMAKTMELSYPTIRNYLNDLIDKIDRLENESD